MKIAVMQPYAFPYIGYFQLINHVDKWVIFDDAQFVWKGWVNRNRILHPEIIKEWQYFTVPIKKHSRETSIKDLEIFEDIKWKDEFLGKLSFYKTKAPYYSETIGFIDHCLDVKCSNLSQWLEYTLKSTCEYLNIPFDYSVASRMEINKDNIQHAGHWALEISDTLQADEYVNPYGGFSIYNENEFSARKIELRFLKSRLTPYIQRRKGFVSGLSIVDVMMWNDKEKITEILQDYQIFTQAELKSQILS